MFSEIGNSYICFGVNHQDDAYVRCYRENLNYFCKLSYYEMGILL